MKKKGSCVVISKAEKMDYTKDCVALPRNYGTKAYYSRDDVTAINKTVWENLETLNHQTGFSVKIKGRKVLIKPNLVIVYHRIGFIDREYPQSTDPRVLDAIIHFIKQYTDNIVIVESSGRGCPTRASFKISGIDRLARYHSTGLIALEEMPPHRYILPKAKVMKEIIVPEIFSEVANGNTFYISVPKMKTNLYTDVTLGLKNTMGTITYNLRQRNHNYAIDQKLVDMLYLFKPGLVVIDGIVGAEGNCPAPVFPVDTRVIISGTNCVETDRVAVRIMGFDPDKVKIIKIAKEMGFGDPDVRIIGKKEPIPFKKADPSLLSEDFARLCPNVRILTGYELKDSPQVLSVEGVDEGILKQMELSCKGGCLATVRLALDMIKYEGHDMSFTLTIIMGKGVVINGKSIWFDRFGKPYPEEDIASMEGPKLAVGSCTADLAGTTDIFIEGCMPIPNAPHAAIHKLMGKRCTIKTFKNKYLLTLLFMTLRMRAARRKEIKKGRFLDCEFKIDNGIVEPRPLTEEEEEIDFIRWDFPSMTTDMKKKILQAERKEIFEMLK